jgi:hypothetical protein
MKQFVLSSSSRAMRGKAAKDVFGCGNRFGQAQDSSALLNLWAELKLNRTAEKKAFSGLD